MAGVLAIAAHWHSQSLAQSGALIRNNDLSKESENPVTRLIMLPLRYEPGRCHQGHEEHV